jgi:hypothetical protein
MLDIGRALPRIPRPLFPLHDGRDATIRQLNAS